MGGREVERLLSSTSESTVNNTGNYRGRQKKRRETGFWRARGAGRKARRTKERAEKGKHYSSMPSKHQMLGYFNKKPPFIWERRRWSKRERVGEDASVWQQAETPSQKLGNGK